MNYHNPEVIIRNLSELSGRYTTVKQDGPFEVVKFPAPGVNGYEWWIANEKGFLWEPALDEPSVETYLQSEEAKEYRAKYKPETIYPRPISDLKYLSVSNISLYRRCKRRWVASYLYGMWAPSGPYAAIGTAVHSIIETRLRSKFTLPETDKPSEPIEDLWKVVPEPDHARIGRSVDSLVNSYKVVHGVEHKFVKEFGDAPPLLGYIDVIHSPNEGVVMVDDHKTNRKYATADWWKRELQTKAYAWAVRDDYPESDLHFRINYVLLGRVSTWVTDPKDDADTVSALLEAWHSMSETCGDSIPDLKSIPATANYYCNECPIRLSCEAAI